MESTNGLVIVNVCFALVVVLTIFAYFTGLVVQYVPIPAGTNTLFGVSNTFVNTTYVNYFDTANDAIVIIMLFALIIDVVVAKYDPNPGEGFVNIFMMLIIAIEWAAIKIGAESINVINVLNSGSGITNTAYNFFVSPYFITVVVFMMMLSAIMHFSRAPGDADGAYNAQNSDIRSTEGIR